MAEKSFNFLARVLRSSPFWAQFTHLWLHASYKWWHSVESSRTRQERIQSSRCVFFLLSTSIPIIPNSGFCQATFHLWLRSRQIIRTTACWKRERERSYRVRSESTNFVTCQECFYHYVRFVFTKVFSYFRSNSPSHSVIIVWIAPRSPLFGPFLDPFWDPLL